MRIAHLFAVTLALPFTFACAVDDESGFEIVERGAEVEQKPCTYTQGYWKTHNSYAKQKHKRHPWPLWEDNVGCGDTWYNWLNEPPSGGDHWLILGHQWVAAMLNQAQGAPVPQNVQDAIWQGQILLSECEIADEDVEEAMAIATLLDDYNNGIIGPGHCDVILPD